MFLKKGDLVDIISPASSITKNELAKIKIFLKANGLRGRFYLDQELLLTKKQLHNFSSFAAKKRCEQLRFALENSDSKAVWCVRGGYGSADIIPLLQQTKKIVQSKMFIGFSDITSLAIFLQQSWDWQIIYAPMLNQLANDKVLAQSKKTILDLVFGKKLELQYDLIAKNNIAKALFANTKSANAKSFVQKKSGAKNTAEKIEGKIVGGCLSVFAAHFSTFNQLDWHDKILFIEDIDESGEKLDRYFCQLVQIMVATKSRPRAILLGNYYFGISSLQKRKNITDALDKLVARLQENMIDVPVFEEKTKCLGHAQNMMPLIIGKNAKISANCLFEAV